MGDPLNAIDSRRPSGLTAMPRGRLLSRIVSDTARIVPDVMKNIGISRGMGSKSRITFLLRPRRRQRVLFDRVKRDRRGL